MKIDFWQVALDEAQKANGFVSPNPAVGAVLARNNNVVGKGHTQAPGKNHAEVEAIKKAGAKAKGATLYVTLEPCCHERKLTGPCTEAVIKAGIKKVIVAVKDPNPLVSGQGIKRLKQAGITVELLSAKSQIAQLAREINQPFFKAIQTGLPYVTLKAGMTLDGKIATKTGESKWITGEEARVDARLERSLCDAVLVGVGTVMTDNPELAPHGPFKNKKLLCVIIDPELVLNKKYQIFRDTNVLVVHTDKAPKIRQEYFKKNKIPTINCGYDLVNWNTLLEYLGEQKIRSVYVEGGAGVHGSLVDAARKDFLVLDRVLIYLAPVLMGGKESVSAVAGNGPDKLAEILHLAKLTVSNVGSDLKIFSALNFY